MTGARAVILNLASAIFEVKIGAKSPGGKNVGAETRPQLVVALEIILAFVYDGENGIFAKIHRSCRSDGVRA